MSYKEIIAANREWVDGIWQRLDKKLSRVAVSSRGKLPYTTVNGVHDDRSGDPLFWTNGFFGGLMWLMYAETGNECYRTTAEVSEKKLDAAFSHMDEWHHDVGFMWHILSGASYRLTGSPESKNRNIIAAMSLMSRYNVRGNFIRCWNGTWEGEDVSGWTIIDCMMNLPILYFASRELGDDRFKAVAMRHADMSMRDHVRPDGSVNHIVVHSTECADTVLGTRRGQGYSADSCWARGDAWALYGFTLSYIHTGKSGYLDTARSVADYFIAAVEKSSWLPHLDLLSPNVPEYYDSTAGAIASCGLIELARVSGEDKYLEAAISILRAMEVWCNWSEGEDSVLGMGSLMYTREQHMPIIYGDYFLTEAILKLRGSEFLPW